MLETLVNDVINRYIHHVDRLNHIYGVKNTAIKLAKIHHADIEKVKIASYLHDITKYEPLDYHVSAILKHYDQTILNSYSKPLYHAFSAVVYAKEVYHITDKDILNAIENHTVGRPNMSLLEKILFVSDYIEPNRLYPSCSTVREIAFKDLDLAVYMIIKKSIEFYESLGSAIPSIAYQAYEFYKKKETINE